MRELLHKNVKVIVLAGNPDCFIARYCHYCITVPDMEKDAKIATFYS